MRTVYIGLVIMLGTELKISHLKVKPSENVESLTSF
jgi:hypothetical protein